MSTINWFAYTILASAFIYASSSYGMPGEAEEEVIIKDFSAGNAYSYAPQSVLLQKLSFPS